MDVLASMMETMANILLVWIALILIVTACLYAWGKVDNWLVERERKETVRYLRMIAHQR